MMILIGPDVALPVLARKVNAEHDAQDIIERASVLTRRCDLDLLVFFARHPHSLLSSESLAGYLGYDPKEIAASLDVLLGAGLIERTQTTAHTARRYVFAAAREDSPWLPSLLALASTRAGRLVPRDVLAARSRDGTAARTGGDDAPASASDSRPNVVALDPATRPKNSHR